MPAAVRLTFRAKHRLGRRRDFEQVYRAGRRIDAGICVIHYHENDLGCDRLGLSVSRKIGGAVKRNRAKRLIRELFRRNRSDQGPWADMVVAPRLQFLAANRETLKSCWRTAVEEIKRQLGRRDK